MLALERREEAQRMEGRSGGGNRKAPWLRAGRLLSDSGVPSGYPVRPEVAMGTEFARAP